MSLFIGLIPKGWVSCNSVAWFIVRRWERFEESYSVMQFLNGDRCWNGPDRSLKVPLIIKWLFGILHDVVSQCWHPYNKQIRLRCGLKDELMDVDEPSRCEYVSSYLKPLASELFLMLFLNVILSQTVCSVRYIPFIFLFSGMLQFSQLLSCVEKKSWRYFIYLNLNAPNSFLLGTNF